MYEVGGFLFTIATRGEIGLSRTMPHTCLLCFHHRSQEVLKRLCGGHTMIGRPVGAATKGDGVCWHLTFQTRYLFLRYELCHYRHFILSRLGPEKRVESCS